MSINSVSWQLKTGADRRIRSRHPWVFSNELAQSPKGLIPGHPVRLLDAKGNFVASGYGNPHSLIAFRAMSFDSRDGNPLELENLVSRVVSCWAHRDYLGYRRSFRLVYGESDQLPGLVIDRYLFDKEGLIFQAFSVQILTAGMQAALEPFLESFFQRVLKKAADSGLESIGWDSTVIVLRNDVNIRHLEGLEVEEARVIKPLVSHEGFSLGVDILIDPAQGQEPLKMRCDLVRGQKTGFFLDQSHNIRLLCEQIKKMSSWGKVVRVLDLCSYVGQWSAQVARALGEQGLSCEATVVDASEGALRWAQINTEREGAQVIVKKLDVLEAMSDWPDHYYDIVIVDPPAFIKAKKDIPTGRHAYLKLNSTAFRLIRSGGLVVSCSCSGLLEEKELMEILGKAIRRNNLSAQCLIRGGHAPDHPCLMSFPEGFYLKMFLHQGLS